MGIMRRGIPAILLTSAIIVGQVHPWAPLQQVAAVSGRAAHSNALAASPKPDWRGANLANTGRLSVSGPATLPAQVFNVHPETFGNTYGIELDGAGNVLYGTGTGHVYSFSPAGTQNWLANLVTTEGSDLAGPPSHPVASSDGAVYIGGDNGNLYQINAGTGALSAIFGTASSRSVLQTPKIGADNTLYVGAADGNLYHLSPSSGSSTTLYTFAASGSTQTSGVYAGTTSTSPFLFYGETALDGAGNAYAASTDTNPNTSTPTLGTVYKVSPTGALVWKSPVQGAVPGVVLLAANPAVPGQTLVIVANRTPQVTAFDAATGAVVWTFVPASNTPIAASPALSPDGGTLYIDNNADTLYALNVATGALQTSFNGTGSVAVGSNASPIVDAAGNVYIESSNGALQGYSPAGAQLFTIPGGNAAGQSGAANGGYMSPAISADGTIYGGGNKAIVRGFQAASVATSTSTPAPTNTSTNTSAPTETPTNSPVPTATNTNTAVPTNTSTNTAVPTSTSTSTNTAVPTGTPTNTVAPTETPTNSPVPTNTSTPVNTATNTAAPTSTSIPVSATATPTNTPVPATNTVTSTSTATSSATSTSSATATPTDSPVTTPTVIATTTSTAAATTTSIPLTPTLTAVPATSTPQPSTATPTNTALSATGTATAVDTATSTSVVATLTPTMTMAPETSTPTPTSTAVSTTTALPATATPTPVSATTSPTAAATTTSTATSTPEATATAPPLPSVTSTSTSAVVQTSTATETAEASATSTLIPAATSTAVVDTPTAAVVTPVPTPASATSVPANTATPTAPASTGTTIAATSTPALPSATATYLPTQTPLPTQPTTATPSATESLPSATTTATAPTTTTATATPVAVRIHIHPRGVVKTTPRLKACRFVANLQELQRGCELVSSTSAPQAALVYTVRYGNGLVQRFTDRADARGHSLRVFNIAYVPPAGTPLSSPLTLVRVTVTATSRFGKALGSASVDFRVVRPRT